MVRTEVFLYRLSVEVIRLSHFIGIQRGGRYNLKSKNARKLCSLNEKRLY